MMNPVEKGVERSREDWIKVLPNKILVGKVALVALVILGNLVGIGYGVYELLPHLSAITNNVEYAEYITQGTIIGVALLGAMRLYRGGKSLPGDINERTIKQYDFRGLVSAILSFPLLFPTYFACNYVNRINYSNHTMVATISIDLRREKFENIAYAYRNLDFEYFIENIDTQLRPLKDGGGEDEQAEPLLEGKTIREWLQVSIPRMNDVMNELLEHNQSSRGIDRQEGGTKVMERTTKLKGEIEGLNSDWEKITRRCYESSKLSSDKPLSWFEKTFLESTPPSFRKKDAA